MVADSRIGPELASAANAASISRPIVWRVSSAHGGSGIATPITSGVAPARAINQSHSSSVKLAERS
jgi:hypothetical protein